MTKYHTDDYIKFLRDVSPAIASGETQKLSARMSTRISSLPETHPSPDNVGDDCPIFDGLYEFCQLSAGGSIG